MLSDGTRRSRFSVDKTSAHSVENGVSVCCWRCNALLLEAGHDRYHSTIKYPRLHAGMGSIFFFVLLFFAPGFYGVLILILFMSCVLSILRVCSKAANRR